VTAVAEGAVWNWDAPPGEAIYGTQTAGRQQAVENADKWMTGYIGRRWICGYREQRGQGALIVMGLPPNSELVRAVVTWNGLPLHAQARLASVKTGLFERDGSHFLFATNTSTSPVQCRVDLDSLGPTVRLRVTDLWTDEESLETTDRVVITLPGRSGGAWRLEPTSH